MLVSWQLGDYFPSLHFVLFVHILNIFLSYLKEHGSAYQQICFYVDSDAWDGLTSLSSLEARFLAGK